MVQQGSVNTAAHRVALELVGNDRDVWQVGEVVYFDDRAARAVDRREVGRGGRALVQPVHRTWQTRDPRESGRAPRIRLAYRLWCCQIHPRSPSQ